MSSSGCKSDWSADWSVHLSPNSSVGVSMAEQRRPINIIITSFRVESAARKKGRAACLSYLVQVSKAKTMATD